MPTLTLDDRSQASNPGGIRLSHTKLAQFHPGLYEGGGFFPLLGKLTGISFLIRRHYHEHLMEGDSRAALVVSVSPLIVAAYTDELDCVALLRFPEELTAQYGLKVGTQLLTVNIYYPGGKPVADLENGPAATFQFKNFVPFIAEFLSDDMSAIELRKSRISKAEWDVTLQMAAALVAKHGLRARDGRPMKCSSPAKTVWR